MSSNLEIRTHEPLARWTWWRIGGPADHFCLPRSVDEVRMALELAETQKWPIQVLGGGSNILVSDQGVAGLVICLRELKGVEVEPLSPGVRVTALAGTSKSEVSRVFLERKMAPALFLCGLPGDMGGGVVMNAGVGDAIRPREFCEITSRFWTLSPRFPYPLLEWTHDKIDWGYRHSRGWEGVIVKVECEWHEAEQNDVPLKVKELNRKRVRTQPLQFPSGGSVFQNPQGLKAGKLIEQAGLKGRRLGGAEISSLHGNFIVNLGSAQAADVLGLMQLAQTVVYEKFKVRLNPEVRLIGRNMPDLSRGEW